MFPETIQHDKGKHLVQVAVPPSRSDTLRINDAVITTKRRNYNVVLTL